MTFTSSKALFVSLLGKEPAQEALLQPSKPVTLHKAHLSLMRCKAAEADEGPYRCRTKSSVYFGACWTSHTLEVVILALV